MSAPAPADELEGVVGKYEWESWFTPVALDQPGSTARVRFRTRSCDSWTARLHYVHGDDAEWKKWLTSSVPDSTYIPNRKIGRKPPESGLGVVEFRWLRVVNGREEQLEETEILPIAKTGGTDGRSYSLWVGLSVRERGTYIAEIRVRDGASAFAGRQVELRVHPRNPWQFRAPTCPS